MTRSKNETIKEKSRFLRGTISQGLANPITGAICEDDAQLVKFHGTYLQDDRDLRPERRKSKLEPAYSFMVRVRVPGGVVTPTQWLALDEIAAERASGSLRLTSRQAIQFHGVLKNHLKATMQDINASLLDTLAACGDVNRNVMAHPNPHTPAHQAALALARALSERLTPRTRAYHEIWLDGEKWTGEDQEPIYGPTYLPRKFKIAVAVPPWNDVDVFTQDLGFVAIADDVGQVIGYDVVAGGGMGMTHGEVATYPRLADPIGFCRPERAVDLAEHVVTLQRDYGDRAGRRHARLKYTIDERGLDWFRAELESRFGEPLEPSRGASFETTGDRLGWVEGFDGRWHHTLFIENGRVADRPAAGLQTGLRALAECHRGDFRLTPNQNLIVAGVAPEDKSEIAALLEGFGLTAPVSGLRRASLACVALPSCGQALAEAERYLPDLVTDLEKVLTEHGLENEAIGIRMTGCPNGCARPYVGEIGLVGRSPGRYDLYLGAAPDGSRLGTPRATDRDHTGILEAVTPWLARYAAERVAGERFGDFVYRVGDDVSPASG